MPQCCPRDHDHDGNCDRHPQNETSLMREIREVREILLLPKEERDKAITERAAHMKARAEEYARKDVERLISTEVKVVEVSEGRAYARALRNVLRAADALPPDAEADDAALLRAADAYTNRRVSK